MTTIELGDLDRGYRAIDIGGSDPRLYSLTCSLYLGVILVAIPSTKRQAGARRQNKDRPAALASKVGRSTPARTRATCWRHRVRWTRQRGPRARAPARRARSKVAGDLDYLRDLPAAKKGDLPVIPVDARAAEVRAIEQER